MYSTLLYPAQPATPALHARDCGYLNGLEPLEPLETLEPLEPLEASGGTRVPQTSATFPIQKDWRRTSECWMRLNICIHHPPL